MALLSTIIEGTFQGNQGAQGLQGTQGLQGLQGLSNQGVQGLQGLQGRQGLQGLSNQGSQGLQGTQGLQGLQGLSNQGSQGLQGLQGASSAGASISVLNDTTTNSTYYVGYSTITSGTVTTLGISASKLTFNPSTGTLSATVFTSLSDQTQKTNVTPIENAIDLVSKMNGVYYDWVDGHNTGSVGVIAQEIEKVLPQVVSTNDQGLKTVSYGNIVGVLIEAIKDQQKQINILEKEIEFLKKN